MLKILVFYAKGYIFIFSDTLVIREGTAIGMLIFGPLLGIFMKIQRPILDKYQLLDTDDQTSSDEEQTLSNEGQVVED